MPERPVRRVSWGVTLLLFVAFCWPVLALEETTLLWVGERQVSVRQAMQRLEELAPWRIAELEGREMERKRQALERLLVPQLLLDAHVAATAPELERDAKNVALATALEARLRAAVQVPDQAVEQYYARHQTKYQRPEAVLIWRITTQHEATARQVLSEVQKSREAVETWSRLAREHSTDQATKMRRGSLGFVMPGGHTDVHEVRVAPSVFQAVKDLQDGELTPEPLLEGDRFSVLWRRGTRPAMREPIDTVRDDIRAILEREATQREIDRLTAELRTAQLRDHAPDLLERVDYPMPSAPSRARKPREHPPEGQGPAPASSRGDR